MFGRCLAALIFALPLAAPAGAAPCGGDFHAFVAAMSREAAAAGISRGDIASAFAGVTQDQAVLTFDRRQRGTFRKSFEEYAATRVTAGRIKRGQQLLQRHAAAALAHRAAVRRAAARSSSRSGAWRAISAPATSASCR